MYKSFGSQSTPEELAELIKPHAMMLATKGPQIYQSIDFHGTLDNEQLHEAAPMLEGMVKLDSRGGYFSQCDMKKGVQQAIESNSLEASLVAACGHQAHNIDEACSIMAYKLRVMLAHIRRKFDAGTEHTWLSSMFEHMKEQSKDPANNKRVERLGSRPNPFLHFRSSPESSDREEDHEADLVVAKYFDYSDNIAKVIKADGSTMSADLYKEGEHGFVLALWLPDISLELEIPNAWIQDEHTARPHIANVCCLQEAMRTEIKNKRQRF